jgi:hypothetical protein
MDIREILIVSPWKPNQQPRDGAVLSIGGWQIGVRAVRFRDSS